MSETDSTTEAPKKSDGGVAETIGIALFKELTLAIIHQTKVIQALSLQIVGSGDPQGPEGLMDRLSDLLEVLEGIDARLTGLNLKLAMAEFVLDRLAEIANGNPEAVPPVPPREPTWKDAVKAKEEFDKKTEEEMLKAEEELDRMEKEMGGMAQKAQLPPSKPPIMSGAPHLRNLPPLPVVTSKPILNSIKNP